MHASIKWIEVLDKFITVKNEGEENFPSLTVLHSITTCKENSNSKSLSTLQLITVYSNKFPINFMFYRN